VIDVSLIGVFLIVSRINIPVIRKGYFRNSNDVCRVGGFTTNSKPIVKISEMIALSTITKCRTTLQVAVCTGPGQFMHVVELLSGVTKKNE
jgi:hypothetical protein